MNKQEGTESDQETNSDEAFHASRIMFVLLKDGVRVAPPFVTYGHLEWFDQEGWTTDENREAFFQDHVRGFFLPGVNEVYVYRGFDFSFDRDLRRQVSVFMDRLIVALSMNEETGVFLGPVDHVIRGKEYQQEFVGKIKDFCFSEKTLIS